MRDNVALGAAASGVMSTHDGREGVNVELVASAKA